MFLSIPQAHSEVVTSLQFSPHSARVFCSTSGDDTAALWDLRHAPGGDCEVARLSRHNGPVNHALFLSDDPWALLTASDDRTIARWDLRVTNAPVGTIGGFGDGINKMLRIPAVDGRVLIASACDDGLVYIHALSQQQQQQQQQQSQDQKEEEEEEEQQQQPPRNDRGTAVLVDRFWAATSTVNDLALVPATGMLATASEDCAVRLWNIVLDANATTEERLVESIDEFDKPVNHIAFAYSDSSSVCRLYAALSEFVIAVDFDQQTNTVGHNVQTFAGHQDYVRGLEFLGDDVMLTVSDDSTAIEWSMRTGEQVRQVKLHEGLIMASATSAARDLLVTGTDTGEIRVWNVPFHTETCGRVAN